MSFLKSIIISALLAGLVAGTLLTGLQTLKVYPLILEAEQFEVSASADGSASSGHSHSTAEAANPDHHNDGSWKPADGGERLFYSLNANILLSIGLALALSAIFALREIKDWRQGVIWGVAGFVAINLAPAVGLPPELPGMPSGDLMARQMWWWGTVACTAAGLGLLFLAPITSHILWRLAGILLLAVPHMLGAPHPPTMESDVPANLAADFATASLATSLVFWVILGVSLVLIQAYLNRDKDTPAQL